MRVIVMAVQGKDRHGRRAVVTVRVWVMHWCVHVMHRWEVIVWVEFVHRSHVRGSAEHRRRWRQVMMHVMMVLVVYRMVIMIRLCLVLMVMFEVLHHMVLMVHRLVEWRMQRRVRVRMRVMRVMMVDRQQVTIRVDHHRGRHGWVIVGHGGGVGWEVRVALHYTRSHERI